MNWLEYIVSWHMNEWVLGTGKVIPTRVPKYSEWSLSWIRSSNSLVIDTEFTSAINSAYGGISKKRGAHKRRFRIRIEDLIPIIFLKTWEKLHFLWNHLSLQRNWAHINGNSFFFCVEDLIFFFSPSLARYESPAFMKPSVTFQQCFVINFVSVTAYECLWIRVSHASTHKSYFTVVRFTPFCSTTPYQFTRLLFLRPVIFTLTSFGWLHYIKLKPYFWWDHHFYWRLFGWRLRFSGIQLGRKRRPCCNITVRCRQALIFSSFKSLEIPIPNTSLMI